MRITPRNESLKIKLKSGVKPLKDNELIEAILGMTNIEGGQLFLGVEDEGEITDVHKNHVDEIGVVALIANKTVPSVSSRAEIIMEEGKQILKVDIPMSRAIVASLLLYICGQVANKVQTT